MQLEPVHASSVVISANPGMDPDLFQEEFCRLVGIPESIPVPVAIEQLTGGLIPNSPENKEKINFMLAFVAAQRPTSLVEAQLLVQLMTTHSLASKMLKKASTERWPENIEKYTNIAMKLTRGYKSGMESLGKYRRNGKQFMHIEHVHVDKDANAIIGNVDRGVG